MLVETPHPQSPNLYTIPAAEFKVGLTAAIFGYSKPFTSYTMGDKVDRGNYVPFLVDGFDISKGKLSLQVAYHEWVKAHTGFDGQDALLNFRKAGGWSTLSREERAFFLDKFMAVKAHPIRNRVIEFGFKTRLEKQFKLLDEAWGQDMTPIYEIAHFSQADFRNECNAFLKRKNMERRIELYTQD